MIGLPSERSKHVRLTVLRFQGDSHLEHTADPSAFFHGAADVFGYRHRAVSGNARCAGLPRNYIAAFKKPPLP